MCDVDVPAIDVGKLRASLKPGQMWRWEFAVGEGDARGWWPATRVTSEGRHSFVVATHFVKYGDTFTIVTVDDEGPYDLMGTVPTLDENGLVQSPPVKTYFVALHNGVLVWFEHEWLEQCKLIQDVE